MSGAQEPGGSEVTGPDATSTFIFADLAGYTALTEAHGDEAAAAAAAAFCRAARKIAREYDAEEVKTIGDAILLRLADAGDAVHLGARLANDVGRRHETLGVRVGIHTGTAVRQDGDWFGSAVNVAARVADAARSGQVLLSDETRRAAGGAIGVDQVRGRGVRRLKNVREPMQLLELVPDGQLSGADMPVDPVCRMAIEKGRERASSSYRGRVVVFCSTECRDAFEHDPGFYARPARRGMSALLTRFAAGRRRRS